MPSSRLTGRRVSIAAVILVAAVFTPLLILLWPTSPTASAGDYGYVRILSTDVSDCAEAIDPATLCGSAEVVDAEGQTFSVGIASQDAGGELSTGQRVIVYSFDSGQKQVRAFHAADRLGVLSAFALITVAVVAVLVGVRGLRACASLAASGLFIWHFLVAGIRDGGNPMLYAAVTAVAILTVVLHFTHGFGVKTLAAWSGTVIGVLLALAAGWIATRAAGISGMGEESARVTMFAGDVNVSVLALAVLLIALIGVLNDIAVAQAAGVISSPGARGSDLGVVLRALDVGRDHASSAIYTIAFSVVAGSLAGLIVASARGLPLWALMHSDTIAYTLIQLLAGIIGTCTAMLATTVIASCLARRLPDRAHQRKEPECSNG